MKYYIMLFLLVILCCSKNDSSSQPSSLQGSGSGPAIVPASAMLNGEKWYADSVYCGFGSCYPNKLYIRIDKHDKDGVLIETFAFQKVIPDIFIQKMYAVTNGTCLNDTLEASYFTENDDVLIGYYTLTNNAENHIKIDSYDTLRKEFSGRFEGSYLKLFGTGIKRIKVTNGKFNGKIVN